MGPSRLTQQNRHEAVNPELGPFLLVRIRALNSIGFEIRDVTMNTFTSGLIVGVFIGIGTMVVAVTIALDYEAMAVNILDKARKNMEVLEKCRRARIGGRKVWEEFDKNPPDRTK